MLVCRVKYIYISFVVILLVFRTLKLVLYIFLKLYKLVICLTKKNTTFLANVEDFFVETENVLGKCTPLSVLHIISFSSLFSLPCRSVCRIFFLLYQV